MRNRSTVLYTNSLSATYDPPSGSNQISTYVVTGTKSIEDTETPRFRALEGAGGILPVNHCVISQLDCSRSPAYLKVVSNSNPSVFGEGEVFRGSTVILSPQTTVSFNQAAIRHVVNNAIASSRTEVFDALTAFAELSKTAGMVGSRINAIFNIAEKCASRAKGKTYGQRLEQMLNYWLEARYGWRPLVYDIGNIMEQFKGKEKAIARGRSTYSEPIDLFDTFTYSGSSVNVVSERRTTGSITYRGFASSSGRFGVRPQTNLAITAWELVPYSFVVDWLIDIGSYIAAIAPMPGIDSRYSGYSVKVELVSNVLDYSVTKSGSGFTVQSTNPGSWTMSRTSYHRDPLGSTVPLPLPRLTPLRSVDLVALILQRSLGINKTLSQRR